MDHDLIIEHGIKRKTKLHVSDDNDGALTIRIINDDSRNMIMLWSVEDVEKLIVYCMEYLQQKGEQDGASEQ